MRVESLKFIESRIVRATFVAALIGLPAWALPTTTIGGSGIGTLTVTPVGTQFISGGLLTQITRVPTCNLTATSTTGPCTDTAFVSTTLANTNSVFLQGAFNGTAPPTSYPVIPLVATSALATAFANAGTGGVSLAIAGYALPVNIDVTNFSTVTTAGSTVAGMTIQATASYIPALPNGVAGPPNPGNPNNASPVGTTALPNINQLVWTQITYDNYFPPSTKSSPATLLDSYSNNGGTGGPPPALPARTTPFNQACAALPTGAAAGTPQTFPNSAGTTFYPPPPPGGRTVTNAYCNPIYPFQTNNATNTNFTDTPQGRWAVPASFRAIDFLSSLSTINGVTTLTVYNNAINYGFDLVTPEPGFRVFLSLMATILIVVLYRRRAARN